MNTSKPTHNYQVTAETTPGELIDWILELKAQRAPKLQIQRLQQALNEKSAHR